MTKALLFIACFLATQFYSQVTIGSGTRVDSNAGLSTPTSIYYGYSLSQQIYLASEIGGSMTISQLKFYNRNNITSLNNTGLIDVWIGHTSLTHFPNVVSPTGAAWIPVSQQEKVFNSGSFSFNGNEVIITLDTPFVYNGTDNLVITVDENKPGDDGVTYTFYQTIDYPQDVSLINRSDSVNPDPLSPPTVYTGPGSTSTTEVQGKKYKAILTLINQNLSVKDEITVGDAVISPNPTEDFINIKTKLSISSIEIFDMNGKKVEKNLELKNNRIDIRSLVVGTYILKINYKEGISTTKKIIKK